MSVRQRPQAQKNAQMPMYTPTPPVKLTIDDLNPIERSVATLGVSPDELKPISWLNQKHHENMVTNQLLSPNLARGIDAYKYMSEQEALANRQLA